MIIGFFVASLTKALLLQLLSLARRPALGRVLVVLNFFHLRFNVSENPIEIFQFCYKFYSNLYKSKLNIDDLDTVSTLVMLIILNVIKVLCNSLSLRLRKLSV